MITYFSQRHAATEMNYCAIRKELLIVVNALRKFRAYLLDRPLLLWAYNSAFVVSV